MPLLKYLFCTALQNIDIYLHFEYYLNEGHSDSHKKTTNIFVIYVNIVIRIYILCIIYIKRFTIIYVLNLKEKVTSQSCKMTLIFFSDFIMTASIEKATPKKSKKQDDKTRVCSMH